MIVRLQKRIDSNILHQSAGIELISLYGHSSFLKSIPSTSEFTWALICALMRGIPSACVDVMQGNWNRDNFRGYQLLNKKIGIVGMGRVGKNVAKYAHVFGMQVGYYDPFVTNSLYYRYTSLDDLLLNCDIITIHVHLTESTYHLLNKVNLLNVKEGCFLVNTSRGKVWDEDALTQVFNTGRIKGIATDVLTDEFSSIQVNPLWKLQKKNTNNVIITPHIGGATYDAMWLCEEYLASIVVSSPGNLPLEP